MADEESTARSWTLKRRDDEQLDRLGTMNSDARRTEHLMIWRAEIQRLRDN